MDSSDDDGSFEYMKSRISSDPEVEKKQERFNHLCKVGKSKEEIFELVELYVFLYNRMVFFTKLNYNKLIGWALPSQKVCNIVFQTYQEHIKIYPEAKLIDFGSGSGIFAYMFNQMGIPEDKIVAVDLPEPTHSNEKQRNFWSIHREENYQVDTNDIFFIGWGCGCYNNVVSYCERKGKCVIILGEYDGCTFSSGFFIKDNYNNTEYTNYEVNDYSVPGAATRYGELLTVNKLK